MCWRTINHPGRSSQKPGVLFPSFLSSFSTGQRSSSGGEGGVGGGGGMGGFSWDGGLGGAEIIHVLKIHSVIM